MKLSRAILKSLSAALLAWPCGGVWAATEYTDDGILPAREEQLRWFLNRSRYAPEAEADRLGMNNTTPGGHPNYDVAEDIDGANDFGTTPAQWQTWQNSKPPLAPHRLLAQSAQTHCRDMAETQLVQHPSPSATYYPLASQPKQRQAQDGYVNSVFGYIENIAYAGTGSTGGYPAEALSPQVCHERLWIDAGITDRGHRKCILNLDAREVGIGFWRRQAPQVISGRTYYFTRDYYVEDPGNRPGWHFLTETVWFDANGNNQYDQNEGVGGIEVRAYQNGVEGAWFDRSQTSGNFAVPIQGFVDNQPVEVRLVNTTASARTVTIPIGYLASGDVTIPAGATLLLGHYTQPTGDRNVGFRDLVPAFDLQLSVPAGAPVIAFNAYVGATYQVESCTSLTLQDWNTVQEFVADAARETVTCPPGEPCGFLRVGVRRD